MSTGPDDTARLERYLVELGATPEELREAIETDSRGTLALDLALRSRGERLPFREAIARAGLEPDEAAALWRALGFPDPLRSSARISADEIETIQILNEFGRRLGTDTMLQLARVIGGSVARIAEAVVDAFRLNVEMPRRSTGESYTAVVEDYTDTAAVAIPALGRGITAALAAHMVVVSRSAWGLDSDQSTVTRELTVGFADLVDYTASARAATPAALANTISRFEDRVADVVGRFGGRVVKLIGDEAMFIVADPVAACELVLELNRALADDARLPSVRTALAAGPVVSHHGDYYGDVVNLAARLVKAAEPGEVLVSESVARSEAGATELTFEPAGALPLKGYDERVGAYRLITPPL